MTEATDLTCPTCGRVSKSKSGHVQHVRACGGLADSSSSPAAAGAPPPATGKAEAPAGGGQVSEVKSWWSRFWHGEAETE